MRELPAGTVTFLFTDVEGSTRALAALSGEDFDRAREEGSRLTLDEAYERALSENG
jgi:class 3 adenylate cyclase